MAIVEADIKLLQSQRLNDDPDGGGFMTGTVVPDGVENNLFPDIADADRVFGRVQLRKVYIAVTSEDSDVYMGAHVILDGVPADPAANALMVTKKGYSQVRSDLVAALAASAYRIAAMTSHGMGSTNAVAWRIGAGPYLTTDDAFDLAAYGPTATEYWDGTGYVTRYSYGSIKPGSLVGVVSASAYPTIYMDVGMLRVYTAKTVTKPPGAVTAYLPYPHTYLGELTVDPPYESPGDFTISAGNATRVELTRTLGRTLVGAGTSADATFDYLVLLAQTGPTGTEVGLIFYGQTETTDALALGATTIPIVSSWSQFIPIGDGGTYPEVDPAILGVDPAPYIGTAGRVQILRPNEACVIHHTATTAPAVVTNGQDVNLGRTLLSKVRVFGNDGNEITAGFTPNLATGHVVFNDVSGYSQPVTIQHRIEDMLLVTAALEQSLEVNRAITHAYPSGAKVSSVMMFGDMQAKVHEGFDQATWTSVWSDTLIGSNTAAEFNEAANPITATNKGAITERWALIFTNSTTFRVVGEQVGEILTGNTATDTAPLNPATLAPYFTIPAAGWGSGWAAGNVYRFNTDGANAPVWLIRSIAPSDPFVGQDSMTVAIRGNVDA